MDLAPNDACGPPPSTPLRPRTPPPHLGCPLHGASQKESEEWGGKRERGRASGEGGEERGRKEGGEGGEGPPVATGRMGGDPPNEARPTSGGLDKNQLSAKWPCRGAM